MKKNWTITQESFDLLLNWLDKDVEKAGQKYQQIREKLIKIFVSRSFFDAEDLADEVFNRVISKIETLTPSYSGEASAYFYGVAAKVVLEARRRKESALNEATVRATVIDDQPHPKLHCLNECLKKLPDAQHKLILTYYEAEKSAKVNNRVALAERLNLNLNSLRVQVCRIRAALKDCIQECCA
jgi:RNA polymerase sigma factor (sigma-70 family)